MKKQFSAIIILSLIFSMLSACKKAPDTSSVLRDGSSDTASGETVSTDISTDSMNFDFTDRDLSSAYNESSAEVIPETESAVKITKEGIYEITGKHSSITVAAPDTAKVQLVLKNADIKSNDGPAIYITSADKVFITAFSGTANTVSDTASYSSVYTSANADGAVFSKSDLTLNGTGTLTVKGNYKCGIVSKDDLTITALSLNVTSIGAALEGKDCVKSSGAAMTLDAGTDGIKSTNTEDASKGFIFIDSGKYSITAGNDGIQAVTAVNITGGTFSLTTGGGAANSSQSSGWGKWGSPGNTSDSTSESSAKGIKCSSLIKISGGSFDINSSDDAIHSNSDTEIGGGSFKITSGDDGIHADDALIIKGGTVSVTKSYEGLEGTAITISGGNIDVSASDDGVNAAGGNDSSGFGRPGENSFNSSSSASITITGGYLIVNSTGDGVDSNGSVKMTGGVLLVSGPTNSGNGAFDYDSSAVITGGTAILCGSSGMAQSFSSSSSQPSLMYTLESTAKAGSCVAISDGSGKVIASFLSSKEFNNIVISSPAFVKGSSYKLSIGGTVSGADNNGYTTSGSVSGASQSFSVNLTDICTVYGNAGGMGGMGGGMGGRR